MRVFHNRSAAIAVFNGQVFGPTSAQRCLQLPGGLHNLDCSVAGDVEAMMQAVSGRGMLNSTIWTIECTKAVDGSDASEPSKYVVQPPQPCSEVCLKSFCQRFTVEGPSCMSCSRVEGLAAFLRSTLREVPLKQHSPVLAG